MEYLPVLTTIPTSLSEIDNALKDAELYVPVPILDFAPGDRRKRYR